MPLPPAVAERVEASPLFRAFDPDAMRRVLRLVQALSLKPQQLLFQRGDPASHFYVVLSGHVHLVLRSRAGEERVAERIGPGQSFAEALMFLDAPAYPLAAIAADACEVLAVPNAEYRQALAESPATCLRLLAEFSQRLHGLVRQVEELSLESARSRLVRHVAMLAGAATEGEATLQLGEPKHMLASRLGIQPETLSRILRALSDEGVISVDGRTIHVRDLVRLRAAS